MLMTLKELAPLIGRSYSTLRIFARLPDFPNAKDLVKTGASAYVRRFDRDEVLAWWNAKVMVAAERMMKPIR